MTRLLWRTRGTRQSRPAIHDERTYCPLPIAQYSKTYFPPNITDIIRIGDVAVDGRQV